MMMLAKQVGCGCVDGEVGGSRGRLDFLKCGAQASRAERRAYVLDLLLGSSATTPIRTIGTYVELLSTAAAKAPCKNINSGLATLKIHTFCQRPPVTCSLLVAPTITARWKEKGCTIF